MVRIRCALHILQREYENHNDDINSFVTNSNQPKTIHGVHLTKAQMGGPETKF